MDSDKSILEKNLSWLKKMWGDTSLDSEEKRLIHPVIYNHTDPINMSIIIDDLDYFKIHYENRYKSNPGKAFAIACLCGSKQIVSFLMEKINFTYTNKAYDYLLSYVSASQNEEWTLQIATEMSQKGYGMPLDVYGLASNFEIMDKIEEIFNSNHQ
jgi:hypothetical protein